MDAVLEIRNITEDSLNYEKNNYEIHNVFESREKIREERKERNVDPNIYKSVPLTPI